MPVQCICSTCGASFFRRPSMRGRYCSSLCAAAGRTVPLAERFWAKVQKSDDTEACWLWTGLRNVDGYGHFQIGRLPHKASRLALEMKTGPLPRKMFACHTCDTPACVRNDDEGSYEVDGVQYLRWGHLWVGTAAANMADMAAKGRALTPGPNTALRGAALWDAKLNDANVLDIRARFARGGVSQTALAVEYHVSQSTISLIVLRKRWTHV